MSQPHTSRDFESELRELRADALAMGARCERAVQLALEAFFQGRAELLAEVEELDRRIDRDEMEIDELVLRILARRQPVARDLRLLTGALRLVTDLERVGDEATNIAERAELPAGSAHLRVEPELRRMGEDVQNLLRSALEAFVEEDVQKAEQVLVADDEVDALYGRIVGGMTEYMGESGRDAADAIRVLHVSKYLERIADHATNIAEEIIFIVRGEDVRHARSHAPLPH